jgi:hypothetical protein
MRKFSRLVLIVAVMAFVCGQSYGATSTTRVKGYPKKSGTYVAPHNRTSPDKSKANNYSSKGNTNPYTGKKGTKDPYKR